MAKLPSGKASTTVQDGALRNIPGFEDGRFGDQTPIFISSPVMTLHTAQVNQGSFLAPCNMEIVAIGYNVIEQPGTAPGTFNVGTRANNDAIVDAFSVALDAPVGWNELPLDDTAVITTQISQGDVIEFDVGGEATTTGLVAIVLVCVPR